MRALRRKVHNVIQTVFGLVRASLLFVSLSNGLGHAVDGAGCLSLLLLLLQCSVLALAGDIFEGVGGCVDFNKLGGHIGPVFEFGFASVRAGAVTGGDCGLGPCRGRWFWSSFVLCFGSIYCKAFFVW